MSKSSKSRKEKVPKLTEEQYAKYITSLKEGTPVNENGEGGDAQGASLCAGSEIVGTDKERC